MSAQVKTKEHIILQQLGTVTFDLLKKKGGLSAFLERRDFHFQLIAFVIRIWTIFNKKKSVLAEVPIFCESSEFRMLGARSEETWTSTRFSVSDVFAFIGIWAPFHKKNVA